MAVLQYEQPSWLYPKQRDIYDCKTRISLTMSGNKLGKTLSHIAWLGEQAMIGTKGMSYTWLAPYYKTAKIAFDLLQGMITQSPLYVNLEKTKSKNRFDFNKSSLIISYPNGTSIRFVSGENVDAIYGFEAYAAVVDEASRVKEEAYNALLTTMFATNGPIKLVANPTIKNNWFYKKWKEVYDLPNHTDGYNTSFKLTALDAIEAGIMSQEVFDWAKINYSPTVFRRDFLAEVPDGEANVFDFEKIHQNIVKEVSESSPLYYGIDLGFTDTQKADYSVIIGVNEFCEVKYFNRFKKIGQDLIDTIISVVGDNSSYIDKTGGGITVYELVKSKCTKMEPYSFTNSTKNVAIENLAHYINNSKISYQNIEILVEELENYEIETSPKGVVTYKNGKNSLHDDTVIALALAVLRFKEHEDKPSSDIQMGVIPSPISPFAMGWGSDMTWK